MGEHEAQIKHDHVERIRKAVQAHTSVEKGVEELIKGIAGNMRVVLSTMRGVHARDGQAFDVVRLLDAIEFQIKGLEWAAPTMGKDVAANVATK